MPVTYTNRKGITYTLFQVPAVAGATRHVFARQSKGTPVDELPAGFRVSENASGVVSLVKDQPSLVKDQPSLVLPQEVVAVETAVRRLPKAADFRVVGQHDRIELYAKALDRYAMYRGLLAGGYALPGGEERFAAIAEHPAQYDPVLRFVLIDPTLRVFRADEKLVFWGAQEWRWLEQTGEIAELARAIVPELANRQADDPFRFDSIVPTAQASGRPSKGNGRQEQRQARSRATHLRASAQSDAGGVPAADLAPAAGFQRHHAGPATRRPAGCDGMGRRPPPSVSDRRHDLF